MEGIFYYSPQHWASLNDKEVSHLSKSTDKQDYSEVYRKTKAYMFLGHLSRRRDNWSGEDNLGGFGVTSL